MVSILTILLTFLLTVVTYSAAWITYTTSFHPIARYPGPFQARVSRLWYMYQVSRGDFDSTLRRLHDQYGRIVRIAPDEVSVSEPAALGTIYDSKGTFPKTDFYRVFHQGFNNHLFTMQDENGHRIRRKTIKHVYDKKSLRDRQDRIDHVCDMFMGQMRRFADEGVTFDLAEWLYRYASEVLGELFFGTTFGHLDEKYDMSHELEERDPLMFVITLMGVAPHYLRPMIILGCLMSSRIRAGLRTFHASQLRADRVVSERIHGLHKLDGKSSSLLDKLVEAVNTDSGADAFSPEDASAEIFAALNAGVDTTAIAMTAIMYEVTRDQAVSDELSHELSEAHASSSGGLHNGRRELSRLPFFQKCFQEALRLHPVVAMPLSRHVPAGGRWVAGAWFPGGTRVGVSPDIIHRHQEVFGPDIGSFKPHRWSENTTPSMHKFLFNFGGGKRACIGEQFAKLEIVSLLPRLLDGFEFDLEQDSPLRFSTYFLKRPTAMLVSIRERKRAKV